MDAELTRRRRGIDTHIEPESEPERPVATDDGRILEPGNPPEGAEDHLSAIVEGKDGGGRPIGTSASRETGSPPRRSRTPTARSPTLTCSA
jgi:hypothetical protein